LQSVGVGDLSVSTNKIQDNAITTAKIAAGAVIPADLSTGAPSWTEAGLLQFNSGYGSVATAYGCRAWVNFNGTGTVAIRASGNVTSITDNGTGDYTVNFTTALPDANYSSVVNAGLGNAAIGWMIGFPNTKRVSNFIEAPTTTAMRFTLSYDAKSTGLDDAAYVNVAIFR
jgi:hypothetical protein